MERITNLMTSQMTLAELNQSLNQLDTTQQQLSSGKRISQPSDDPYGTSLALQLDSELAGLNAYSSNVSDGTAWTQTASSALSNIDNVVQRVRELVVQAASGSSTAADGSADAAEVGQLIDQIKQEANTQYNGQYIFSGTATTTAPYQSGSGDTYQGNSSAVNRLIGPGTTVQVNADISQLLGNGQSSNDGKLLDTLRTIVQDMQSGNTAALSGADLQALDSNFDTLTSMESNMGAVTDRLQLASTRISGLQDTETAALSSDQDTDMSQAAINLSNEQAAYSAALRAGADIVQSSLMDFLSG